MHTSDAAAQWAELAAQHDGRDRWYLEALGIGADGQWDAFLDAWLAKVGDGWNTPAGRDILWRSRGAKTADYLGQIIKDPATTREQLPRYFRALDFVSGPDKDRLIASLVLDPPSGDEARRQYCLTEALVRLDPARVKQDPKQFAALEKVLDQFRGTEAFVRLVDRFGIESHYEDLLALAAAQPDTQLGVEAIRVLLARQQPKAMRMALEMADPKQAIGLIQVLGNSGDGRSFGLLAPIVNYDQCPDAVRQEAVRALAKSKRGGLKLAELAEAKKVPTSLVPLVAFSLHASSESEVKAAAARLFPLPPSKDAKPLPPLSEMLARRGDAARGKIVFETTGTCAKCHIVAGQGKEVGPNLSEIGGKLSREAMFESILYPSAGISHNYETYTVLLDDGNTVNGIVTSETPEAVSIKGIDAIVRTYPRSDIEVMEKQKVSLMPADLQKLMTAEELIDVIAYLGTLKPPAGQQRASK
jgi:putative heme-binding domain-containing protein